MQSQGNKEIPKKKAAHKTVPQNSKFLFFPNEVIIFILSHLRAHDLSNVQQSCAYFNDPDLITAVTTYVSEYVYPSSLTDGYDTSPSVASVGKVPMRNDNNEDSCRLLSYELMRNMELLVVARVLSRPEPLIHTSGYYVSKSWCKTALKWLDAQMEQQEQRKHQLLQQQNQRQQHGKKKGKKLSKKQQRLRNRKLCDVSPPWPNINHDILCEHGALQHVTNSKTSRARRKVMDKQAWKILKKLYPDSIQLSAINAGCIQCALEAETAKKVQLDSINLEKLERKKVLNDAHVRKFYTRPGKGLPIHCLKEQLATTTTNHPCATATYPSLHINTQTTACPLIPGIYYTLPREWCYKWRKYVRSGDGERPHAPDASNLLCDAHKLPLIPPHLEDYLYGYTTSLLGTSSSTTTASNDEQDIVSNAGENIRTLHYHTPNSTTTTTNTTTLTEDEAMMLSTGIITPNELHLQRFQYLNLSSPNNNNYPTCVTTPTRQEYLDINNQVVVEILTEDEYLAIVQYWPEISKSFVLKFAVVDVDTIVWSTSPCQDCDAGHPDVNYTVRNRARGRLKKKCV